MSPLNTRVVRRSNALMGFPWGEVFTYEESLLCRSRWSAAVTAAALGAGMVLLATRPSRALARHRLPKPGEGPSREQREAGYFELFLHGKHPQKRDRDVRVRVAGDRDPGYGATARMLGEAALCLARDDLAVGGGFWTPASAMAGNLVERLQARAGLRFEVVESG
jgi:short subunit dehydrogenase-like uncharacterized protein